MFPLPFCSVQAPRGLPDAQTHQGAGRGTALLKIMVQMLIFFRDTLTNTPRNEVLPATWASLAQSG